MPEGATEWEWVADARGGGEWMPPGLNATVRDAISRGIIGIGEVRHAIALARAARAEGGGDRNGRPLDVYERVILSELCEGQSINCSDVRVVEGSRHVFTLFTEAITLGNTIHFRGDAYDVGTLVHEMAHVWQYQTWGATQYYAKGFATQLLNLFVDQYDVDYPLNRPFGQYSMEQQAVIMTTCIYSQDPRACAGSGLYAR